MNFHRTNPQTVELGFLPSGIAGTRATLALMAKVARVGKRSLPVRTVAQYLTRKTLQRDFWGEISTLTKFVRDRIRYVRDVRNVETIQTPEVTLRQMAGDCDDKATLLSALLESIGHHTRFDAFAFNPDEYTHVLTSVKYGGEWIPLETTLFVAPGELPFSRVSSILSKEVEP